MAPTAMCRASGHDAHALQPERTDERGCWRLQPRAVCGRPHTAEPSGVLKLTPFTHVPAYSRASKQLVRGALNHGSPTICRSFVQREQSVQARAAWDGRNTASCFASARADGQASNSSTCVSMQSLNGIVQIPRSTHSAQAPSPYANQLGCSARWSGGLKPIRRGTASHCREGIMDPSAPCKTAWRMLGGDFGVPSILAPYVHSSRGQAPARDGAAEEDGHHRLT